MASCLSERSKNSTFWYVLVTVDRNLPYQHNLSRFSIAIVVLRSRTNRLADLRELVPELLTALRSVSHEQVTWGWEAKNRHGKPEDALSNSLQTITADLLEII
jgi:hypothetical protein